MIGDDRRWRYAIALALFALFVPLYSFSIGVAAVNLSWYNFVFDADPIRIVSDAFHGQNPAVFERHALFSLVIGAPARLLGMVLSPAQSVLTVVACLAALGVVASFFLFLRITQEVTAALLLAVMYGLSATHWVLASIPETFAVNSAFIVTAFLMHRPEFVQPRQHRLRYGVNTLATAVGTGVSAPNIVYGFLSHASALRAVTSGRRIALRLLLFLVAVGLGITLLGVLQNLVAPGRAQRAVLPTPVAAAARDPLLQGHPIVAAEVARLARAFTLDNIVAPPTVVRTLRTYDGPLTMLQYGDGFNLWYGLGLASFVLLAASLFWSSTRGKGWQLTDRNAQLAVAMIVYNLAFHYFYRAMGQPFIFTIHTVIPLLVLIAIGYAHSTMRWRRHILAAAVVFAVANNALFLRFLNSALDVPCAQRLGNVCLSWQGRENVPGFREGLETFLRSADYPYERGRVAFVAGQLEASIPHLRQAVQMDPNYVLAHLYLGSALIQAGRVDEAVSEIQSGLRRNPSNPDLQRLLQSALALKASSAR